MTFSITAEKDGATISTPEPGVISNEPTSFNLEGSAEEIITKLIVMAAGVGAAALDAKEIPPYFNKENKYLVIPNPFYGLD